MTEKLQQRGSLPCHMKAWALFVMFMFVVSMIPAKTVSAATSISPGVKVHTPDEIRQYIKNNGVDTNTPTTYSVTPSLYDEPGEMDDVSKNNALKMLNNIRYVLGLSPVALDDDLGKMAQAAAFVCNSINDIQHEPENEGYTKPENMPQDVWDLGVQGCAKTNLAYASRAYPMNWAVLCWMDDGDNSNIKRVGHRRWIMNPAMGKTGFGRSSGYYAMYSFDTSGTNSISGATVWPAQNMPFEYFENDIPWNIGLGQVIPNIDSKTIHVQLIRERDGKTWNFTQSSETPVSGQDYYHIHNLEGGYFIGRKETNLIFRPADLDIRSNDVFHVKVTGDVEMSYDVNFFPLAKLESMTFTDDANVGKGGTLSLKDLLKIEPANAITDTMVWSSDDESIATVDSNGKVTGVELGETTITATLDGQTAKCKVKVAKNIADGDFSYTTKVFTYTGEPIKPFVRVTYDGKNLTEGQDYELECLNNVDANYSGSGTINIGRVSTFRIAGKGDFGGTLGAFWTTKT